MLYSKRSIHGQVVHAIGQWIVRGEVDTSVPFPTEHDLQKRFQVSRTAVREAVKVLAAKGLIETRPKVGIQVRPRRDWNLFDPDILSWQMSTGPDKGSSGELVALTRVIEPEAAALAADAATAEDQDALNAAVDRMARSNGTPASFADALLEFHTALYRATHNAYFERLGRVSTEALSYASTSNGLRADQSARVAELAHTVIDAIGRHNANSARKAMTALIEIDGRSASNAPWQSARSA